MGLINIDDAQTLSLINFVEKKVKKRLNEGSMRSNLSTYEIHKLALKFITFFNKVKMNPEIACRHHNIDNLTLK